jgi:hypothetical protein
VTRERVNSSCDDHVEKQRRAQLSLTYRFQGSEQAAEILRARTRSPIGSDEWRIADEKVRLLDERRLKRQPSDRHAKRMSAFYVDLADGDNWSRPCELDPPDCAGEVVDALNDYTGARERIEQAAPLHADQDLATAIAALAHPPTFPPTPWPSLDAMLPPSTKTS